MFTATITKKDFRGGVFQVTVEYVNGGDIFTEAYNINSVEDLNGRIENKLNTLNKLLELELSLLVGEWTKPVKEAPIEPTALELAQRAVDVAYDQLVKELITKEEYTAKVAAYKVLASA